MKLLFAVLTLTLFALFCSCGNSNSTYPPLLTSTTTTPTRVYGPIDGTWTLTGGSLTTLSNSFYIASSSAILSIFTNGTCKISLAFSLSYPASNQLTLTSVPTQAGDIPIGCAQTAPAFRQTAQQIAQNLSTYDGTYSYISVANAAGTHLTLTSTVRSGVTLEAYK